MIHNPLNLAYMQIKNGYLALSIYRYMDIQIYIYAFVFVQIEKGISSADHKVVMVMRDIWAGQQLKEQV